MITLPKMISPKHLEKIARFKLFHTCQELGPGLGLVLVVAALAKSLALGLPNLGEASVAILCGMVLANLTCLPARLQAGIAFAEKQLLAYSVVLLGFGLTWHQIQELGWRSLLLIVLSVVLTILTAAFLGRMLGLSKALSLLLGLGNAICGSSAVAASAPLLTRDGKEIGLAISVVNLLGTLGLFFLPALVNFMAFSDQAAGLLVGGSLQAVGHVVAAGFAINPQVGDLSLAIKMSRIFLLAPTLLVLALVVKNTAASPQKKALASYLPGYLYGFIGCACLANAGFLAPQLLKALVASSHFLLLLAMTGIGLRIKITALLRQGPKAFLLGFLTFSIQILMLLLVLANF